MANKETFKEQLIKRLKSLLWRVAGMAAVVGISLLLDNAELLNLHPMVVTMLGLVMGEITKALNKKK